MTYLVEIYILLWILLGAPLDTLVAKEVGLPQWYAPGESSTARLALEEMALAAKDEGILLWVVSGYRDFTYQQEVQRRADARVPDTYRSFSAEPGHSEHQLGTAFDISWPGLPVESLDPRNLELYTWLANNAHRYGYVISYPYKEIPDWPFHNRWMPVVTEYIYEPWHIRYVGKELARKIFNAGYLNPGDPMLPQAFYQVWPEPDF